MKGFPLATESILSLACQDRVKKGRSDLRGERGGGAS